MNHFPVLALAFRGGSDSDWERPEANNSAQVQNENLIREGYGGPLRFALKDGPAIENQITRTQKDWQYGHGGGERGYGMVGNRSFGCCWLKWGMLTKIIISWQKSSGRSIYIYMHLIFALSPEFRISLERKKKGGMLCRYWDIHALNNLNVATGNFLNRKV